MPETRETWDVWEGRPSWHQQRAGNYLGAAVTSGFTTLAAAQEWARAWEARHPGEPATVMPHQQGKEGAK